MGGVVVAAIGFTAGKILPSVVSDDAMGQAIFNKTVEDAVDGHPVHSLFQFGRNTVVT